MSNLTDFLLARVAEDDEMARAKFDVRGVRECEARRNIVKAWERRWEEAGAAANNPDLSVPERNAMNGMYASQATGLGQAIHLLAAAYADHPDYREDWRP